MKNAVLGGLVGAGLVLLAIGWQGPVRPVYADYLDGGMNLGEGLIAFSTPLPDGGERVTIIHPGSHAMGVYRVIGESGQIALESVRNFHWDLQMREFNNAGLSTGEVQGELEAMQQRH